MLTLQLKSQPTKRVFPQTIWMCTDPVFRKPTPIILLGEFVDVL
jgi:hypothetical protein